MTYEKRSLIQSGDTEQDEAFLKFEEECQEDGVPRAEELRRMGYTQTGSLESLYEDDGPRIESTCRGRKIA